MPRAINIERRREAVEAYEQGEGTLAEIAARYGVSEPSLRRWRNRARQMGTLEPSTPTRHGPEPMLDEQDREFLRRLLKAEPRLRLQEVVDRFCARSDKTPSVATVRRALVSMGLSRNAARAESKRRKSAAPRRKLVRNSSGLKPGRISYPSDLSDAAWGRVRLLLEQSDPEVVADGREILDALSYLSKTGCPWSYLPHDLPSWERVLARYQRWWGSGLWDAINQKLDRQIRISSRDGL